MIGFLGHTEYIRSMKTLEHAIQIVPLADTLFNRCKSNIAWIDASQVGARTVAPDWEEWRKPGVTGYGEFGTFKECVQTLINDPETLIPDPSGWSYVVENLTLSQINRMRKAILDALLVKRAKIR